MREVEANTRELTEVLRVNTNKIKDSDYLDSAMKRLN